MDDSQPANGNGGSQPSKEKPTCSKSQETECPPTELAPRPAAGWILPPSWGTLCSHLSSISLTLGSCSSSGWLGAMTVPFLAPVQPATCWPETSGFWEQSSTHCACASSRARLCPVSPCSWEVFSTKPLTQLRGDQACDLGCWKQFSTHSPGSTHCLDCWG